ncbi:hypothetical protein C9374_006053 [Naegleria lovaniensis]|uniref:Mic1 domain-containing protein n=1 Tax=Naegleria lovaniensis TaxID=51637 RepID=A0AA88GMG5_NAELO|nr:uncharacterized protein C9374_006053 [Naegleria lovaniensis]KAG2381669.1 hypothetical protein C9374_006053 [Naegleria lovaniensis]
MKINDFVLSSPPNSNKPLHSAALVSESSSISSSSTNEAEQNIPDQLNITNDYVQSSSGSLQHYLLLSTPICNIQLNNIPDNFGGVSASFTTEENRLTFNETNREIAIFNSKKFMLIPLVRGETIAKRLPSLVDLKGIVPSAAKASIKRTFIAVQYDSRRLVVFSVASSDVSKPQSSDSVSTYSIDIIWVKEYHKPVKILKTINENVRFCKFSPNDNLLVVAVEGKNASLFPFLVTSNGQINKLPKVDLPESKDQPLQENETFLVSMYGRCCLVCVSYANYEIHIYKYKAENTQAFVKQRIFNIFSGSNIAVNVVDSLLIVHNLDEKSSVAYDVFTKQDSPVSPPLSISPHSLPNSLLGDSIENASERLYKVQSWTYWLPNYIYDKELGFIFELKLSISHMPINIRNRKDAIKFLFRRVNSKPILISALRQVIESKNEDIKNVSEILELVNKYYWNQLVKLETEKQEKFSERLKKIATNNKTKIDLMDINALAQIEEEEQSQEAAASAYPIVEQSDMYKYIFLPIDECGSLSSMELVTVIIEYIRGLKKGNIPVHYFIQKLLIELLVKSNNYSMLHQLVQFKVIGDSKLTALQMLHISEKYKPAYEISLDMLKRLGEFDLLCEILLSRRDIKRALDLMLEQCETHSFKIPYSRLFETALSLNEPTLFYNTYEILQRINLKQRKNPHFVAEDKCKEYEELFQKQFVLRN